MVTASGTDDDGILFSNLEISFPENISTIEFEVSPGGNIVNIINDEAYGVSAQNNDLENNISIIELPSQEENDVQDSVDLDRVTNDVTNSSSGEKKYSKKRRLEKKRLRNAGQEYTTLEGKPKAARTLKDLPTCRRKCREKLSDEIRTTIFQEYWCLGSRDRRLSFVSGCIESCTPKTKRRRIDDLSPQKQRTKANNFFFRLKDENIQVCRNCFMCTLGESNMFITTAIENRSKSVVGIPTSDQRGKTSSNKLSQLKITEIIEHINSFPAYESHYSRKSTEKKYLPHYLNLTIMYNLYKEKVGAENAASRTIYSNQFHELNLSFKKLTSDTCNLCDSLNLKIKSCPDSQEKIEFERKLKAHQEDADFAYSLKKADKEAASSDSKMKCYAFDLQQCLPTPMLQCNSAFYKRKLWTYNLTVRDMGQKKVHCFMWSEVDGGRGANQIATCIYELLKKISLCNAESETKLERIVFYSDAAGGQNRNSHVSAMFLTAMENLENLDVEIIDHKFMVSGHSHLECDVDHAAIEKQKKKLDYAIHQPLDWFKLVSTVGGKEKFKVHELGYSDFLDFADLFKTDFSLPKKDDSGSIFKWTDIRWLRYRKNSPRTIFFKNSLVDDEPFRSFSVLKKSTTKVRKTRSTMVGRENLEPKEIIVKKCYAAKRPISKIKKSDLLELLPYMHESVHEFYKTLPSSDKDVDEDYNTETEDEMLEMHLSFDC